MQAGAGCVVGKLRIAWPLQEAMSSETAEISLLQLHQSPEMIPKCLCLSGLACKHLGMKLESNSWFHFSGKNSVSLHRLVDVNTEQRKKSQGDSATGFNSLATGYPWILTQALENCTRVLWGVSNRWQARCSTTDTGSASSEVKHKDTHLNWLKLVLSVIIVYLKYKLNWTICTFQKIDVLWGYLRKILVET